MSSPGQSTSGVPRLRDAGGLAATGFAGGGWKGAQQQRSKRQLKQRQQQRPQQQSTRPLKLCTRSHQNSRRSTRVRPSSGPNGRQPGGTRRPAGPASTGTGGSGNRSTGPGRPDLPAPDRPGPAAGPYTVVRPAVCEPQFDGGARERAGPMRAPALTDGPTCASESWTRVALSTRTELWTRIGPGLSPRPGVGRCGGTIS
jgi:hypothetical protein